jgi:hypothetical protein
LHDYGEREKWNTNKSISGYSGYPFENFYTSNFDRSTIMQSQGFKREERQHKKVFEAIQIELDKKEIEFKNMQDAILKQEKSKNKDQDLNEMKLKSLKYQQAIYLESIQDMTKTLTSKHHQHLQTCMARISEGLQESSLQYSKMIDKLYSEMVQVKLKTSLEVKTLTQ